MTRTSAPTSLGSYSESLVEKIGAQDFSGCTATVVGYGNMGRQYVQALLQLGVEQICVCSRSPEPLEELKSMDQVKVIPGGFLKIGTGLSDDGIVIVCTPTSQLVDAAQHLAGCGVKEILIEKPVSLHAAEIRSLSQEFISLGIDGFCAYNRTAYPTVLEARALCEQEGGVTSCTYTFTEFIDRVEGGDFTEDELARWGIANSLHVMSLAHSVIGMPKSWSSHRSGGLPWHPTGSVFVGSGVSEQDVPFSYQADWGSTGRWSVEFHTRQSSYRLCPLEELTRRDRPLGDWETVNVVSHSPEIKYGVLEQVAAFLSGEIRSLSPLASLEQAAALSEYGEQIFGYQN